MIARAASHAQVELLGSLGSEVVSAGDALALAAQLEDAAAESTSPARRQEAAAAVHLSDTWGGLRDRLTSQLKETA